MGAYIKENWLFVVVAVSGFHGTVRALPRICPPGSLGRFPGAVAGGGSFWCAVCRESASQQ